MAPSEARFRIRIRNWEKHQREMRGEGKRRRRRDWIALSTDISRDPDVLALTVGQRWLWVAMLAHAGRVGQEFEITAHSARLLFGLRPGWRAQVDLDALSQNGFIALEMSLEAGFEEQKPEKPAREPAKRTKKRATSSQPEAGEAIPYPVGLNVEAWERYQKYRREARIRKYTPEGALKAMRHWAKYPSEVQAAAVEVTIEKNWHGCFPERFDEKTKGHDSFDNRHQRVKTRAGLD